MTIIDGEVNAGRIRKDWYQWAKLLKVIINVRGSWSVDWCVGSAAKEVNIGWSGKGWYQWDKLSKVVMNIKGSLRVEWCVGYGAEFCRCEIRWKR